MGTIPSRPVPSHTPHTIHHTPHTIHHTPYTIHHTPHTILHTPYTMHHAPYTIHTPYTIHHTPHAIHHTPHAMHHTPRTIHHYTIRHTPYTNRRPAHRRPARAGSNLSFFLFLLFSFMVSLGNPAEVTHFIKEIENALPVSRGPPPPSVNFSCRRESDDIV